MRNYLNRRNVLVVSILGGLLFLGLGAVAIWRAERALDTARVQQRQSADLGVDVSAVAPQPNPGFEAISAPAIFRGMVEYKGRLYLSGPQGLSVYDLSGQLEKVYRVGMELPPAPLGTVTVGVLIGARHAEVLIATDGAGVLAFDGETFREIAGMTEESRAVTALLPVASGRLLIGTKKSGVLVFDGKTLRRLHPTLDNIYVTALAGDESALWVGTLNDGLLIWRGGQTQRITEAQGLPDPRVEAIAQDGARVYVGTPMGVAELGQDNVERVLAKGQFVHALAVDGNSLLIGQIEEGIARLNLSGASAATGIRRPIGAPIAGKENEPGSNEVLRTRGVGARPQKVSDAPPGNEIEGFLADGENRYALTRNGLLRQEPDGEWREVLTAPGAQLTERNISALAVASDNSLWVGYFDRGLDILHAASREVTHVEDEHVFCVNRILENPRQGEVLVATANGLVLFGRDGRQQQVLGTESGLIAQHVTDVTLFGAGMALATPAGITFLDPGGAHSIYAFQGLVNNHVYAIGANNNQLAAGTLGGISLIEAGDVQQNLNVANSGLKHNWITALAPVGDEWLVGTYGAGIERLSGHGVISATDATQTGLVVNPTAMATGERVIVAGTLGQGLWVGDRTGIRWRAVKAGLPSMNVTAVAVQNGVVYVGTDNGLVKIAEEKL
jgi:ligand-binding sensor domain-containing protein